MTEVIITIILLIIIGICLFIIKKRSVVGKLVVITNETGGKVFSLEVDVDPEDLASKKFVIFKVTEEPHVE